jgi:hypothetical protein
MFGPAGLVEESATSGTGVFSGANWIPLYVVPAGAVDHKVAVVVNASRPSISTTVKQLVSSKHKVSF